MILTITKVWKLRDEPKSSVLIVSIKGEVATLSVRNTLDEPKPIFIAVHTFRLDSPEGFRKLYSEAAIYLNSYYMKQVKKFVRDNLVVPN